MSEEIKKRTPICIIKSDVRLTEILKEAEVDQKQIDEKVRFLKKQSDDLDALVRTHRNALWKKIESYLEESGILKDASSKALIIEDGVLYDDPPPKSSALVDFLRKLTE